MKIALINHFTGIHGPGSREIYEKAFRSAFPDAEIFTSSSTVEWNDFSHSESLNEILSILANLESSDIVVFPGFAWHSRPLHLSPAARAAISKTKATRICIFQESYLGTQSRTLLSLEMHRTFESAKHLVDIAIFNHYRDYIEALRLKSTTCWNAKIFYLPFVSPFDTINDCHLEERKNKFLFVGSTPAYGNSDPYYTRCLVLNQAPELVNLLDWIKPETGNQHVNPNQYYELLSNYRYSLVAPSIDSSLTVRPIEAAAAGCIPILPRPLYKIERNLFEEGKNCFYFNPFRPMKPQLERIISLHTSTISEIQRNAIATANAHDVKALTEYIRLLLEQETNGSALLLPYYAKLSNEDNSQFQNTSEQKVSSHKIAIDMAFYQYADTGIAKVWTSILEQIADDPISSLIVLIIREDSQFLPAVINRFPQITAPKHQDDAHERDSFVMNWICEQEDICVFVSTYMTYTSNCFNISMIHDCIPERVSKRQLYEPTWQAKKSTIEASDVIITISEYSAREIHAFYPSTKEKCLVVAKNGTRSSFLTLNPTISSVQRPFQDWDNRPYCLLVGERCGYLGYKNGSASLQGIVEYNSKTSSSLKAVLVGGWRSDKASLSSFDIEPDLYIAAENLDITREVVDDAMLKLAYQQAVCLLYLSEDEGYGLPIYEALHSGGRVVVLDRPYLDSFSHPNLIKIPSKTPEDVSIGIEKAFAKASKKRKLNSSMNEYQLLQKDSNEQFKIVTEILYLSQSIACQYEKYALLRSSLISSKHNTISDAAKYVIKSHPNNRSYRPDHDDEYKLTFLTSTYKSQRFIGELINDIDCQNNAAHSIGLNKSYMADLIIIDSHSPENEIEIFKSRPPLHTPYLYYKTPFRETLYAAWNRGVRLSKGTYITNANTDDRHSPLFMAVSALYLDNFPNVQLAYPDQIIVESENIPYISSTSNRRWAWPSFTYSQLLTGNHVGSTPVWRRSLHHSIGYFRSDFVCAADWDFWLRIASQVGALGLINIPISSYLFNPLGIEHGNPSKSLEECIIIQNQYQTFGEYKISKRDEELAGTIELRSLDDMQYNGITADSALVIVVPSIRSDIILDILALPSFESNCLPIIISLNVNSGSVLPSSQSLSLSNLSTLNETHPDLERATVLLHRDLLTEDATDSAIFTARLDFIGNILAKGQCSKYGKFLRTAELGMSEIGCTTQTKLEVK
jgi:hypothetical protein